MLDWNSRSSHTEFRNLYLSVCSLSVLQWQNLALLVVRSSPRLLDKLVLLNAWQRMPGRLHQKVQLVYSNRLLSIKNEKVFLFLCFCSQKINLNKYCSMTEKYQCIRCYNRKWWYTIFFFFTISIHAQRQKCRFQFLKRDVYYTKGECQCLKQARLKV